MRKSSPSGLAWRANSTLLTSPGLHQNNSRKCAASCSGISQLVSRMTLQEKVAQITQLDINELMDHEAARDGHLKLDPDKVSTAVSAGVGSFLNSPTAGGPQGKLDVPTAAQWRDALSYLETAYVNAGKTPPVFGLDSMHGAAYVKDAIMFPHALHAASSFNTTHAWHSARSAARHTRAAGVSWVFAPVLDLPMASRFPRVYESCGEDPALITAMGVAFVQGLQGMEHDVEHHTHGSPQTCEQIPDDLAADDVVAACMKHFVAYQASRSGYDRGPSYLPDSMIRQYFLPPFLAAVRAGVATAMTAYNAPSDIPVVTSQKWTGRWLRGEAAFQGLVVTDWTEIYNQIDWHRTAATPLEAITQALTRSSLDLAMVPYHQQFLEEAVEAVVKGYVPMERLDLAVTRMLALKQRLGYLPGIQPEQDRPEPRSTPISELQDVPEDVKARERAQSLQAARDGTVLLKNTGGVLPLDVAAGDVVAVVGPNAQSAAHLLGAWTYHWQGAANESEVPFDDVATAVSKWMAGKGGVAVAATGVTTDGEPVPDRCLTVAAVASTAIIYVYGEGLYAEVFGNIPSAYLPTEQAQLAAEVRAVADARGVPLVGVYVGGRDRLLAQFDALFDAHMAAFFPGPFGGAAIADIISGAHCPCARLPITLHAADAQSLPYWHSSADFASIPPSLDEMSPRQVDVPLYSFGAGLSYTKFEVSDVSVTVMHETGQQAKHDDGAHVFTAGTVVIIKATVQNTGTRKGGWPFFVKVQDNACIVPPAGPMLKRFGRVQLAPGESSPLQFTLNMDDFAFEASDDVVNGGGRFVQPGSFTVVVEDVSFKLTFAGDPLLEGEWLQLDKRAGRSKLSPPLF
eukprot:jgi/Ulvmu1/3144/UM015_0184.1